MTPHDEPPDAAAPRRATRPSSPSPAGERVAGRQGRSRWTAVVSSCSRRPRGRSPLSSPASIRARLPAEPERAPSSYRVRRPHGDAGVPYGGTGAGGAQREERLAVMCADGIMGPELMDNMHEQGERFGAEPVADDGGTPRGGGAWRPAGSVPLPRCGDGTASRVRSAAIRLRPRPGSRAGHDAALRVIIRSSTRCARSGARSSSPSARERGSSGTSGRGHRGCRPGNERPRRWCRRWPARRTAPRSHPWCGRRGRRSTHRCPDGLAGTPLPLL